MSYSPNNPNGQATMANSAPVVLSSDQSTVPVSIASTVTVITTTITHQAAAYASGRLIGGKLTFANAVATAGGSGIITDIVLSDKDSQNIDVQLVLFESDPTNTTFTENAALDIHDTDLLNVANIIGNSSGNYASFADNSVARTGGIRYPFKLDSGTTLYGCLVCRGTPTYTTTTSLQLKIYIE